MKEFTPWEMCNGELTAVKIDDNIYDIRKEQKETPLDKLEGMKQCTKCKQWKDKTEFNKEKNHKGGLRYDCKKCQHDAYKQWCMKKKLADENRTDIHEGMKECAKCKQWKDKTEFSRDLTARDSLHPQCKKCRREYAKQQREKTSADERSVPSLFDIGEEDKKQCTKCKQWKDRSEFYKKKDNKDGLRSQCKECKAKYYKQWKAKRIKIEGNSKTQEGKKQGAPLDKKGVGKPVDNEFTRKVKETYPSWQGYEKIIKELSQVLNENPTTIFSPSELKSLVKNILLKFGYAVGSPSTVNAWIKYFMLNKQIELTGTENSLYTIVRSNSIPKKSDKLGFLDRLGLGK